MSLGQTIKDYAKDTFKRMTSAHGENAKKLVEGAKQPQAQPQQPLHNWVDEEDAPKTTPVQPTTPAPAQKTYTFADVLNETGEDPAAVRKWLAEHPGYKPGEKTNAWLAAHPVKEEAKTEQPVNEDVGPTIETSNKEQIVDAVKDSDSPDEAANTVADAIGADKEQKKQIEKATKSIWSAVADGSMSPEAGGYFLLDAIMKQANNRQRRDSNYIENLSRAAAGDTILGYDVSKDEKSKYETMVQDPALERANTAAGIESESNAQTAADLSTANQQQQYGEAVGPQGLAQTASTVSAMGGNFDTVSNAFASGDPTQVEAALNSELQNPQIQTQLSDLERKLKEGTLNADIEAANIMNKLSNAQVNMLNAQAKLLGFDGDLKQVLSNAIRNAGAAIGSIGGGDMMQNAGSLGMLVLLSKLGVM